MLRRTSSAAAVACALAAALAVAAPASAQTYKDPDAAVPQRVEDLLGRMTLDEKIGQMTQAERVVVDASPGAIATFNIGSLLSGGGSGPAPNTPEAWADMYDRYQRAALGSRLGIPLIYGIDAVHGHNNVRGATFFPHNIGLGAMRDPALVKRIGEVTAREVAGTGIDWNFAPCLCVARNDRWGRTYESFGEVPELPTANATLIDGLQGERLGERPESVLATAKHYVGDGGTTGGDDRGNTELSEAELRRLHLPPFVEALRRNVGTVMTSYSSWNGQKVHGHRYLVNDLLKGELGFKGFVISDYAGIDEIDGRPGYTPAEVAQAINAGIDMVMVPHDYPNFQTQLRSAVLGGQVSQERIDDAVRRILTKKFELGLFERPLTDRRLTGTIGSPEHRAVAREAVRKSQVLLRNEGRVLPLPKTAGRLFVAGKSADDVGNQSGGWSITWQGKSGNITPATTVLSGIKQAVSSSTRVTFDAEGDGIDGTYDAAIAVIGETPYAEYEGDRPAGMGLDERDRAVLDKLKAAGVPVVVVLVSGRPLEIADRVGEWDALVAAWLPGTEGAGVADVLFGDYNPTGKLPVTWMRSADQQPINAGDGKDALFPFGFGLRYPTPVPGERARKKSLEARVPCTPRRRVTLRLRRDLRGARVRIRGMSAKRVRVVRRRAGPVAVLDLRRVRRARVRVTITGRTRAGRRVSQTRTLRMCRR